MATDPVDLTIKLADELHVILEARGGCTEYDEDSVPCWDIAEELVKRGWTREGQA